MDKLQQIKEALQLATQFKSRGDTNVITLDAWYALHGAKPLIDKLIAEDNNLKAENKRLRDALEWIALSENLTWPEITKRPHNFEIAKQALQEDKCKEN